MRIIKGQKIKMTIERSMPDTPALTVDCVIFRGDAAVLIKRGVEPYKGCYALPGGFVDLGETVEQACVREVKEEIGIDLYAAELRLVGVFSDPRRDTRGHTVSVVFLAENEQDNLVAGDDAHSVEVVSEWRTAKLAFDHSEIIERAWNLKEAKLSE